MIKRGLDVVFAAVGLLVLWPLLLISAILIRRHMGSPILFRQVRPGLHGKGFTMYKFRTMRDELDGDGMPLSDYLRLTHLGKVLRRTSIDELPQLVNILKGDMSFIGPRPLLEKYLPYYNERERQRHHVRPGLTGLAQVSGRNLLNWNDRLELDVQYVERQSLLLDARILMLTVRNVLLKDEVIVDPRSVMSDLDKERLYKVHS
ncbi:hypothetical protein SY83_08160 [Paenibacillus swuensis]|uniref:Bacterial sugar transferase domain-containing protein n=1 Tax=Paenibacillus swuensis TaxID=1178515 RepID=A0A172TGW1_9BACL|nr:sugar transferase [Paenibacillus swuensis]ANE46250.1 hypothetical protein SY83_08160 [Paenibacillus swuensis]